MPVPAAGALRWQWNEFHDNRKLRLEEGDIGYSSWTIAKHAFFGEIEAAFRQAYYDAAFVDELGNMDNDDPAVELLDQVVESFPLFLREI